jgi:hypothetical protein
MQWTWAMLQTRVGHCIMCSDYICSLDSSSGSPARHSFLHGGVLPFIVLHRVGFPVVGLEVCCHCATDLIWRTDVQETAWRCPWHADILKFLQIWETAVTHGRLQDGTSGCSGASSGEQISTWHHWNDPGGDVARIPTAAAGKCWVLTFLETFETFWNLFTSLYISLLFYWFLL